jgi:hypothetical protein
MSSIDPRKLPTSANPLDMADFSSTSHAVLCSSARSDFKDSTTTNNHGEVSVTSIHGCCTQRITASATRSSGRKFRNDIRSMPWNKTIATQAYRRRALQQMALESWLTGVDEEGRSAARARIA